MAETLLIGKMPFANLHPLFYVLEREFPTEGFEFVEGYPSALNRMLREGALDVSPSSSVEYLRHADKYFYLDGHSISCRGPIRSIFLFSSAPLESLGGTDIHVTHQSETSVALLEIILRKFHSIPRSRCRLISTAEPFEQALAHRAAYLSIGDEALRAMRIARPAGSGLEGTVEGTGHRTGTIGGRLFYIFDLGDLWHRETGLPFTFALWIARKNLSASKTKLLESFQRNLDFAKALLPEKFPEAALSPGLPLPPEEIVSYWKGITYGFDGECKKGLELFRKYLEELNLL